MTKSKLLIILLLLLFTTAMTSCRNSKQEEKDHLFYDSVIHHRYDTMKDASLVVIENSILDMLHHAEEEDSRYGKMMSYFDLSQCLIQTGRTMESLQYLRMAQTALDHDDPPFIHAYADFVEGTVNQNMEYYGRSIDNFNNAEKQFEKLNDSTFVRSVCIHKISSYLAMHNYDVLHQCITKAEKWANNDKGQYRKRSNDAERYLYRYPDTTIAICRSVLRDIQSGKMSEEYQDLTPINCRFWVNFYYLMGEAYLATNKLDSAWIAAEKMMEANNIQGREFSQLYTIDLKGRIAFAKKDYKLSETLYKELYETPSGTYPLSKKYTAATGLANSYKAMGNYKEACRYMDSMSIIRDSITYQKITYINNLSNSVQAYRDRIYQENTSRINTHFWFSAGFTILLVITMVFMILYNYKHRSLQRERTKNAIKDKRLQKQREELAEAKMIQAQTEEQILDFSEQIKTIAAEVPKSLRPQLMENIERIQEHHDKKSWINFEEGFARQYPGFVDRLMSVSPSLTPNDIKICMLIKVDIPNKEIASILHLSPDSVKTYRQKIRKKFQMDDSKQSLNELIQSF